MHSSVQWIHLVVHCSCMCVVGMGEHTSAVQLVFTPLSFFLTQFEASKACDSSIVGTAVWYIHSHLLFVLPLLPKERDIEFIPLQLFA